MAEPTLTKPLPNQSDPEPTRESPIFQPKFDILENDQELTLHGDLPGVEQDDLDIRYENEQLVICGHVKSRNEGLQPVQQEYGIGDFHRVFTIGESIDAQRITAEIHNGVLVMHLPKTEAVKPKRIKVKSV